MSSRRPLFRSFSGSGRYSSFDGDVITPQSSRAEGRSYQLNMRTETRSTVCSVMAQLAVETQPSFETTLKSKAVSESCNVKFTCVVSGNPTPEVTWYKDDMEMDRYCGLPKYEIFSSDKTHTLQIYNCTQDDAAIYQASARNSKGIVTCSGLLEVGAMNEFKIHQRFFAKLKQKADSKMKDLEQSRHRGGETMRGAVAEQPRPASPVRKPRFVRFPSEPGPTPPLPSKQETKPPTSEDEPAEQPEEQPEERPVEQLVERPTPNGSLCNEITNGFTAHQDPIKEKGKPTFLYFGNKVEIITKRPATKDTLANKVVKMSREPAGGSAGDSGSAPSSSGKQKEADEGEMSLARYLTEYSSSELFVPQRNGAPPGAASKPGPVAGRQVARERETAKHKGAPGRGPPGAGVPAERVSAETVVQKGPESPSTLASMFFSLRDMFFRSRNKNEDPPAAVLNGIDPPHVCSARVEGRRALPTVPLLSRPEPPQTHQREDGCIAGPTQTPAPQSEHVELDRAMPSVDVHVKAKTQPPEPLDDHAPERRLGLKGPSPGIMVRSVASPPSGEGAGSLPASDWSRSPETAPTPQPPPEMEVTADRTEMNGKDVPFDRDLFTCQRKEEVQPSASTAEHMKAETGDTHILQNHIHSASGTPQFYADVLDESQKKCPNGPGMPGLDSTADPEDASDCPVMPVVKPGLAEPPVDTAAEEDRGVNVSAGEIQARNLRSLDNNGACVQEPAENVGGEVRVNANLEKETKTQGSKGVTETAAGAEKKAKMEGKEIPMYTAHKNENRRLPWVQGEKGINNKSPEPPMQVKLLEVAHPENMLQNVPEVVANVQKDGVTNPIHTPEPRPELMKLQLQHSKVPQVLDQTCSKTAFLKSKVKDIIKPPTPLTDNTPTISNLLKDEKAEALVMAENTGNAIPVTPIQPISEGNKGLSQPQEIQNTAEQDREVKTGREMANRNSCGEHSAGMAADSAPVISNSVEDNSQLTKPNDERQLNSVKSSIKIRAPPKVPTFVMCPISITCTDRISPENNQPSKDKVKELDSLATLLQGVMNDMDSCVTLSAVGGKKINLTPCCVEEATPANDSDVPLGITTPKTGMTQTPSSVSESPLENVLLCADVIVTQPDEEQQPKLSQAAFDSFTDRHIKEKSGLYKNNPINPESPLLSATTPRRDPARDTPAIPAIRVDSAPLLEKWSGEGTVGDAFPPPELSCESSPQLRKRDSLTPIPSATPEELASGARRKIFIPKSKMEEVEASPGLTEALEKKEEVPKRRTPSQEQEAPYMSPSQCRRPSLLQLPTGQHTPPLPRRSPLLGRKKTTLEETVKEPDNIKTEPKSEKDKLDPLKAPRVIRKVRAEPFPDNVGHLKLCCQFFNVLSDSTIKWCRDETEIVEVNRSAGDESQVALAIVQVSSTDCGVYSCSINNEYGTDSTDFLLSAAILPEFLLRADLEVGQEIEMTPMLFTKGLADPGCWGNKFFGRIMITESHIGDGCTRKACRVKVIYGLEPAFESGSTCIIKVRSPISYGKKDENNLVERNLEITQQECKVQNIIREYCKVFSAEARVAGNFGPVLEVIPLYLMYQPANTIPYTTAEADLKGVFLKHCLMDATGRLVMRIGSEAAQMCCTFQHWIHQWTNGNLLLAQLEGVDGKITNVRVATKLMGYQGLSDKATPKVFEQFVTQHQCNDYCSLLGLRSLKVMDSLMKGPRSPMLNRRGLPSPQILRKGGASPQTHRKVSSSPRLTRRSSEPGDGKPAVKNKTVEVPKVVSTS